MPLRNGEGRVRAKKEWEKIRWTKQRTGMDCGPAAIANIMKWIGGYISYKRSRKEINKFCEYTPENGCSVENMCMALPCIKGIKIKDIYNCIDTKDIASHVKNGGIVLIRTLKEDRQSMEKFGHYFLCVGQDQRKRFVLVNEHGEKTVSYISPKKLDKKLIETLVGVGFIISNIGWFLDRKKV